MKYLDYRKWKLEENPHEPGGPAKHWIHTQGFCGCGRPEVLAVLLRDALDSINRHAFTVSTFRDITQEEARWLLVYVLDQMMLTEHGTGLSAGGWPTDDGKAFLADLREEIEAGYE